MSLPGAGTPARARGFRSLMTRSGQRKHWWSLARLVALVLIVLIVLSGSLLAATVGFSALTVKPPYLMYAWALLAAVSVAVVLMLGSPPWFPNSVWGTQLSRQLCYQLLNA